MLLVAVDQAHHSVNANIISSLSSRDGGFSEGQQTQSVERNPYCTLQKFWDDITPKVGALHPIGQPLQWSEVPKE